MTYEVVSDESGVLTLEDAIVTAHGSAFGEATVLATITNAFGETVGTVTYTITVADVVITDEEDVFVSVGNKAELAGLTGELNTTMLDSKIATVQMDANGKVTAVANGNVWVYATDGVGMGKCIVRVKGGSAPVRPNPSDPVTPSTPTTPSDPSAANAKLNREDMTLAVGDYFAMKVKNYDGEVTWSVKDPSIASILNDGTVKALKSGRTTITAKVGDRTLECIVRVKN